MQVFFTAARFRPVRCRAEAGIAASASEAPQEKSIITPNKVMIRFNLFK